MTVEGSYPLSPEASLASKAVEIPARSPATVSKLGQLLLVVLTALFARALYITLTPDVVSGDLSINWTEVARQLTKHKNPYNTTGHLNWPPLWMQLLYGLKQLSVAFGIPWFLTVRLFTTTLDLLGLGLATWLLAAPDRRATRALLFGWALNPSAILIACQHCNFDGLVVLWCVLAIACLAAWLRARAPIDWLLGCAFVGLGVLTKTVPVILVSLLAGSGRRCEWKAKLLGALLVFGPAALGISILYVLGPKHITQKVIHYHSYSGWYGITGLMHLGGADVWIARYASVFPLLLLVGLAWVTRLGWRDRLDRRALIGTAAWLLLFVPTIGPGYGPQYAAWSLPFLTLMLAQTAGVRRGIIIAQLGVTAVTQIVEYGLLPSHGQLWLHLSSSPRLQRWGEVCFTQEGQTLLRLPLFAVSLLCLGALAMEIVRTRTPEPARA